MEMISDHSRRAAFLAAPGSKFTVVHQCVIVGLLEHTERADWIIAMLLRLLDDSKVIAAPNNSTSHHRFRSDKAYLNTNPDKGELRRWFGRAIASFD